MSKFNIDDIDTWKLKNLYITHDDIKKVWRFFERKGDVCMLLEDIARSLRVVPSIVAMAIRELEEHGWVAVERSSTQVRYEVCAGPNIENQGEGND